MCGLEMNLALAVSTSFMTHLLASNCSYCSLYLVCQADKPLKPAESYIRVLTREEIEEIDGAIKVRLIGSLDTRTLLLDLR